MTIGRDQHGIPLIGLGTWLRTGAEGLEAILTAIELGYRHIDTAQTYGTESVIGEALKRCGVPREELFITTKVADDNLERASFMPSLRESLDTLGVDQVDLTLIHWPSYRDAVPFEDYMNELARAQADGLTRLIGVSNYTIALIERSVALLGANAIATNQVELHPFLQGRRLSECCRRHDVTITAYMPLAKGRVVGDPVLQRIAEAHDTSPATVSLAWLLHHGMIVIPASGKREHMASNLDAASLTLSDEEIAAIDALDRGDRIIDPAKAPDWDVPD